MQQKWNKYFLDWEKHIHDQLTFSPLFKVFSNQCLCRILQIHLQVNSLCFSAAMYLLLQISVKIVLKYLSATLQCHATWIFYIYHWKVDSLIFNHFIQSGIFNFVKTFIFKCWVSHEGTTLLDSQLLDHLITTGMKKIFCCRTKTV